MEGEAKRPRPTDGLGIAATASSEQKRLKVEPSLTTEEVHVPEQQQQEQNPLHQPETGVPAPSGGRLGTNGATAALGVVKREVGSAPAPAPVKVKEKERVRSPYQPQSWTDVEDETLLGLVARDGECDWNTRAADLGTGRTGKACQTRFKALLRKQRGESVRGPARAKPVVRRSATTSPRSRPSRPPSAAAAVARPPDAAAAAASRAAEAAASAADEAEIRRSSRARKKVEVLKPGTTFVGEEAKRRAEEEAAQQAKDAVFTDSQPTKTEKTSWMGPGNARKHLMQPNGYGEALTTSQKKALAPHAETHRMFKWYVAAADCLSQDCWSLWLMFRGLKL